MIGIGTIVNFFAVIAGSILGILIHSKLPDKIIKTTFQGIGLFTLFIGIQMGLKSSNLLILIFSIILGSITGELLKIEERLESLSKKLKRKIKSKNDRFTEGLITSFLLFCMGSMSILGCIQEGIGGSPDLLLAKSALDGFSSIALASSMGSGVLFSSIPLLIYQGSLTLFASYLKQILSPQIINELTAVGGLLLIGLGINLLEIKKIKILNMLPALLYSLFILFIFLIHKYYCQQIKKKERKVPGTPDIKFYLNHFFKNLAVYDLSEVVIPFKGP